MGNIVLISVLAVILKKKKMKTLLYILTLILFISCGQKNSNSTDESKTNDKDSIAKSSNFTDNEIEFKKYVADGMFINGKILLFDNNLKIIGRLEIDKTTLIQILEKSSKMYNVEGNKDMCEKAHFIKVIYQGKDYTVFGKDVYEINIKQKFSVQNEKNEKLTLFPITNFKMGVFAEEGLTGCDDYSLLILLNEKRNEYSLMKYPNNEEIHNEAANKYAILFHDDGAEEKIYKLTVKQDTLIIGIKATYQEGGSVFNLKVKLSGELPETRISDRILFETYEDLKKMDEIK